MEPNIENVRDYCLQLGPVTESFPFDSSTLVFKIGGKAFALLNVDQFEYINMKCDPEKALTLRQEYPEGILPGYHMNKKHWNSVYPFRDVPPKVVFSLIDHSFQLIVGGLTKNLKNELFPDEL